MEFAKTHQMVELGGIQYRIASNSFLIGSLPFIMNLKDRDFILALNKNNKIEFQQATQEIQMIMNASVYEYQRGITTSPKMASVGSENLDNKEP